MLNFDSYCILNTKIGQELLQKKYLSAEKLLSHVIGQDES
jgi:hypothetical protein